MHCRQNVTFWVHSELSRKLSNWDPKDFHTNSKILMQSSSIFLIFNEEIFSIVSCSHKNWFLWNHSLIWVTERKIYPERMPIIGKLFAVKAKGKGGVEGNSSYVSRTNRNVTFTNQQKKNPQHLPYLPKSFNLSTRISNKFHTHKNHKITSKSFGTNPGNPFIILNSRNKAPYIYLLNEKLNLIVIKAKENWEIIAWIVIWCFRLKWFSLCRSFYCFSSISINVGNSRLSSLYNR